MVRPDYNNSSVNLKLGDDTSKVLASKILYEAAKLTWKNRAGKLGEVVELFDDFSGLRATNVGGLPADTYSNINFDGVGTKVEPAERLEKHDTVAYDLLAMVCDDAVVRGAEPVIVGSVLDVRSLGEKIDGTDVSYINFVKQLALGYVNAAREANVAIINGEVAELGPRVNGYGKFNYNWGAGVVWFARKSRMLTGHEIKEGDVLVGLREHGFRSNGLSLARKIMKEAHGEEWHEESYGSQNLAELLLHPSRIYCKSVVEMLGSFDGEPQADIHGVTHITGGGIPEKLRRTLKPSGLGANLDNLFEPCSLMKYCQEKGSVTDAEAYKTWNMGQGMLIMTPSPDEVVTVAHQHGIESRVIGEVITEPIIRIKNKGIHSGQQPELIFPAG